MATISKQLLSGSTNGMPISLTTNVTSSAVLIHTAVSGTSDIDEVWVWATNVNTTAETLTLEIGTTNEDQHIMAVIQPDETVLVLPGLVLQNAKVINGFSTTANKVNVFGFVNRLDV
tara:strand:+ start:56 stop:406 length:351 start_codon:yes stop_codon:yes gene_type:complete